jgi:hypothetical protein
MVECRIAVFCLCADSVIFNELRNSTDAVADWNAYARKAAAAPPAWRWPWCAMFLRHLEQTGRVKLSADLAAISHVQVYRTRRKLPAFRSAMDAALAAHRTAHPWLARRPRSASTLEGGL